MRKNFNPDTEIPDLTGKVIVVTGGTYSQLLTTQLLGLRRTRNL